MPRIIQNLRNRTKLNTINSSHFHALKYINFSIEKSETVVVCGQSGSDKSTMIRCINRLEHINRGSIIIDGVDINIEKQI